MNADTEHGTVVMRVLVADDIDAMLALEQASQDAPWTRGMFEEEVARDSVSGCALGAFETGKLVAMAFANRTGETVHILDVVVAQELRRHGFGSKLVGELVRWADGSEIVLEVREGNVAARAMYERFGFSEIGRRVGYYPDNGEDAVVMSMGGTPT